MTRRQTLWPALVGAVLLAAAALLGAWALVHGRPPPRDRTAEAAAGCRAFDRVWQATAPGAPLDAPALAAALRRAQEELARASADDPRWRQAASGVEEVVWAVNAHDTAAAAAAIAATHQACSRVETAQTPDL